MSNGRHLRRNVQRGPRSTEATRVVNVADLPFPIGPAPGAVVAAELRPTRVTGAPPPAPAYEIVNASDAPTIVERGRVYGRSAVPPTADPPRDIRMRVVDYLTPNERTIVDEAPDQVLMDSAMLSLMLSGSMAYRGWFDPELWRLFFGTKGEGIGIVAYDVTTLAEPHPWAAQVPYADRFSLLTRVAP